MRPRLSTSATGRSCAGGVLTTRTFFFVANALAIAAPRVRLVVGFPRASGDADVATRDRKSTPRGRLGVVKRARDRASGAGVRGRRRISSAHSRPSPPCTAQRRTRYVSGTDRRRRIKIGRSCCKYGRNPLEVIPGRPRLLTLRRLRHSPTDPPKAGALAPPRISTSSPSSRKAQFAGRASAARAAPRPSSRQPRDSGVGPLTVPLASKSPGRRLQPLLAWCVTSCAGVQ